MALLAIAAVAALLPVVGTVGSPAASALPLGFVEQTVLSGLTQPMALRFSPDGRVFVAEKSGLIKVFDGLGDPSASVVLDLRTQVYNNGDRGLMSIEAAPTFPIDPTLYALYARDAVIGGTAPRWGTPNVSADPCPNPPGDTIAGCTNSGRLSRFTLTGSVAGPEQVMIDDWCQQFPSHAVGDLKFGPDGYLYASGGEGASYTFADYGQAGTPVNPCGDPPGGVGGAMTVPTAEGGSLRSQDLQTPDDPQGLSGSIIRIDPSTTEGAPGNPFATSTDRNRRRIIASGLRNPYRFTFRPGSGELWLGEVGSNQTDEINRITSPIDGTVRNFGWPCREGNAKLARFDLGLDRCEAIYSGAVPTTAPYDSYSHASPVVAGDGCASDGSSISGVAFYPGGSYPDQYDGALFFADYSRRCIWAELPGSNGLPDPATRMLFRQASAFPVDLQIGPNNDLFYVDIAAGAIRRIRYNAGAQPPTAAISATPAQGPLPLTTTLSAASSSDPQGTALTYAWDLDGDGEFDDATGATTTRTYTVAGAFQPTVRVTNGNGLTDTATTRVLAGTTPPTATISAPATTLRWNVGDPIAFAGSATDAEDGALPASSMSWQVVLNHCTTIDNCHDHVLTAVEGAASGSFPAPDHDYPASLELRLTATDSSGVSTTTSRRLLPNVVDVRVETDPPGLQATIGGTSGAGPLTTQVIVGSRLGLSTPATQTLGSTTYVFAGWSDGGARVHDVFIPAGTPTYRATFAVQTTTPPGPAPVAAYNFDEGTGTAVVDRSGNGNDGAATGPTWVAGRTGTALSFDGTDDVVTVPDAPELDLTAGFTVEAWVRPMTTSGWRTVAMKERPGGLSYALYASSDGPEPSAFGSLAGADRSVYAPAALPTDTWSHLAGTYDGTTMRILVNGVEVASEARTGALDTSSSPLRLGGNSVWGEYLNGAIDDVRIYDRALTTAQIAADRDTPVGSDATPPTAPTNLVATPGSGQVALAWTASTDAVGVAGYDIHRSPTSGFAVGPTTLVGSTTGATTFTDPSLAVGTYRYRVVARDAAGNTSVPSTEATATLGDATAPTVALTAPTNGATVTGSVAVTASATDATGVAGVQFRLDGLPLGAEDLTSPYSVTWSTGGSTNGNHVLTAVARDTSGNSTTSTSVTVRVDNPPIATYSFDEGSGTILVDRSGRGHTGTVTGPTWVPGRTGGGLSFDGIDDLVTINDTALLDVTKAFTVEAWVRPAATTSWSPIAVKEAPGAPAYALYASGPSTGPTASTSVGGTRQDLVGPTVLAANTWAHVAVTYDGLTLRLYVNGVQVATRSQTGATTISTGALRLGGSALWGQYLNGVLDDVRIYNRALRVTEIVVDRNTPVGSADVTAPSTPTNLVATPGGAQVALSWTAATDAVGVTGYDVHRSTVDGFTVGPTTLVGSTAGTTFADGPLAAGTYRYRVVARDAAGNTSTPSAQATATVADATAPTVAITAPASGATVTGLLTVTADAADASGVAGVQFRLDGAPLGAEDTTSPFAVVWNSAATTDANHVLTAVARDGAGNTTTSVAITVTASNPPIAAYSFDEGSGTTLIDRSGRGHTGTVSGPTWTAGTTGGALRFDGVDDLVTIADSNALDLTKVFTIEAWVRPTTTTGWSTIAAKEAPDRPAYALYACGPSTGPTASTAIGGTRQDVVGPTVLPVNTWTHVAITYDNLTMRLYVNGVQVATRPQGGATTTSTGALRLGGSAAWGEYLNGSLDDVRIYSRALPVAQIRIDRTTPVT